MYTRRFLSSVLWSRFGAPIRALRGPRIPPASNVDYWDGQVSGFFAPRLGGTVPVDARNRIIETLLRHHLPSAKSALDIGCAGGTLATVLLGGEFDTYCGVDISKHSVEAARQNVNDPRALFAQGTLEEFQPARQFDVIVLSEVLYYVEFPRVVDALLRYANFLNPDGAFCISLNLHPQGTAIQRVLAPRLSYVNGLLYQEKARMDTRFRPNRERPLTHTFLATVRKEVAH